jgi:hypothetical protein
MSARLFVELVAELCDKQLLFMDIDYCPGRQSQAVSQSPCGTGFQAYLRRRGTAVCA